MILLYFKKIQSVYPGKLTN